jgi:hypothetical protein
MIRFSDSLNHMRHDVALDNPAELPEHDEFNRWPFSQRLASTIAGFDASQGSPVLGLFGKWGQGKSTVLNFVRKALNDQFDKSVTVFAFNPWMFSNQEALLQEFFMGLGNSVEADLRKPGRTVGQMMTDYGGALSWIPFAGTAVSETVKNIGKQLAKDPIQEQRERLTECMKAASKKVVVLIDDLDRLDREEIMTMLKVVRLSANFPNVIYLLAFDEERVARVAGQAYGEAYDGRQFLEKIIQYPFSLPAISSTQFAAYVLQHAQAACKAADLALSDKEWDEFLRVVKRVFLPRALSTPRQAIRYANALRFALPLLKGEVDPFDQMIVEAMRIFFPVLYAYVRDNLDFDQMQLPDLPADEKNVAEELIKGVLLRWERAWDKPVSNPRYHDRYFSYAVASSDIADAELSHLIVLATADDPMKLDNFVRALATTRVTTLTERLSLVFGIFDTRQARNLAIALARIGDLLPNSYAAFDDNAPATAVGELISHLALHVLTLQRLGDSLTAPAVIENATPLPFALLVYRELNRLEQTLKNEQASANADHSCLTGFEWDQLGEKLLSRVTSDAQSLPPYEKYAPKDALRLLSFWRSRQLNDERAWLGQRISEHPREVVKFLGMFDDKQINYDFIAEFVEPGIIVQALERHFANALQDSAQSSEELADARQFLDTYKQRLALQENGDVGNLPATR